jgi:hypothetical protein
MFGLLNEEFLNLLGVIVELSCPDELAEGQQIPLSWYLAVRNACLNHKNRIESLEAVSHSLCDTTPQNVGSSGSAGSANTASRCDHVHQGVHKLIAGAGVTLSPSSGLGDVTVTVTGVGGQVEGDYSNYQFLKEIMDPLDIGGLCLGSVFRTDEKAALIVDYNDEIRLIDVEAGTISDTGVETYGWTTARHTSSVFGKYAAFQKYLNPRTTAIFKNCTLLQTISTEEEDYTHLGCLLSPFGKYLIIGIDKATGGYDRYYYVYEGV